MLKGRDRNTASLSGVNNSLFNSIGYKMDRLQCTYFSEGEKGRPEMRLLFAGYSVTSHNCKSYKFQIRSTFGTSPNCNYIKFALKNFRFKREVICKAMN